MKHGRSRFLAPILVATGLGGLVAGAAIVGSPAAAVGTARAAAPTSPETVVINLTHGTDDLHAVTMALELGRAMAERGADVSMFLNLEAVRLVDERQPLDLQWGTLDQSVGELYQAFVEAGGKVMVCPHCAKVAGLTQKNLRPGATLSSQGAVVDRMLAADKVIDY